MKPFEIDETSNELMWVKIRHRIIFLIESGYYKPGDKLPTVRALAAEVNVNMNTISRVYQSLVSDDYIETTRGRGAFVKELPQGEGGVATELGVVVEDFIDTCRNMGMGLDDIQRCVTRRITQLKFKEDEKGKARANVIQIDPRLDRFGGA